MANNNQTDVLLNVKINVDDKIAALAATKQQITELKDAQKLLDQRTEEGRKQYEAYATQIRELNSTAKSQQKEIDNTIKAEKSAKDSVEQLKAKLQLLTEQYNKLSAAEKKTSDGKDLASKIKGINEQLTESSKQTGGFSGKLAEMAESMKGATSGFGGLLSVFGKFAPGIGIATTAFEAVKNVMESTRGAMNEFKAAMEGVSSAWDYMLSSFAKGNFSISGITSAFNAGAQGKIDDVRNKDQQAAFKVIEARTQGEVQELLDQMGQTRDKAKKAEIGKKAKELIVSAANQKEKLLDKQTKDDFRKYYEKTGLTRDDLQELYNFEAEIDPELLSTIRSTSKSNLLKKITPEERKKLFSGQKTTLEPKDYSQSDNLQTLRYLQLSEKRDLLKDEQKDKLDEDLESYYEVKAEKYASIKKLDKQITGSETAADQQQKQALKKKYQDELKVIKDNEAEIQKRTSDTPEAQKKNYLDFEKQVKAEVALYKTAAKQTVIDISERNENIKAAYRSLNDFTKKSFQDRLAELDKEQQELRSSPRAITTDEDLDKEIEKYNDLYNKKLDVYDGMLTTQKISQKQYNTETDKEDNQYFADYNTLVNKRLASFTEERAKEVEANDLANKEKIAGDNKTIFDQHTAEMNKIDEDEKTQLARLEKQKTLLEAEKKKFPEFSDVLDVQINENVKTQNQVKTNATTQRTIANKNFSPEVDNSELQNAIKLDQEKLAVTESGSLAAAKIKNDIVEKQAQQEINSIKLTEQQKSDIIQKYGDKGREFVKNNEEQQNQIRVNAKQQEVANTADAIGKQINKYTDFAGQLNDLYNEIEASKVQKLEESFDTQKRALSQNLSDGLITQKQYNKQLQKQEDDLAAKKKKIAREEAEREKALKIFQTIISTAEGVVDATSKVATIPLVPYIIATGATELATIIATPIPAAARGMFVRKSNGGLLNGRSHAQGGIPIEAEGGEAIINKRSTAMYKPLLSAINEAGGGVRFANGGIVESYLAATGANNTRFVNDGGYSARAQANTITASDMHEAMLSAVSKVKVYTTVEDYRKADKNYTNIESSGTV